MKTWICLAGAVLCLFTFITLHRIQKASMGNPYVYSISSTMRPAVALLKKADSQRDKKEVEALEKIIDENYVREHPEANGEIVFVQTKIGLRDISSNDYNDYMRALFKLAILRREILCFLGCDGNRWSCRTGYECSACRTSNGR